MNWVVFFLTMVEKVPAFCIVYAFVKLKMQSVAKNNNASIEHQVVFIGVRNTDMLLDDP